ncbi:MAG: hypothetical protein M0R80_03380 [Proteobacteria bacterium]|jgi:hypothetical protein|nr:hypothetical protein [Pseudomonadota bacterium]
MTEIEYNHELACAKGLQDTVDPLSQLLYYQALERCRNYIIEQKQKEQEKK